MQELGPPLHKVASLFAIQFLFLNFSVVFQLLKGQASKQGPERLCGFHPCTQNSLGQDAEQNDLGLCALSWAAGLETSREPFQLEFLYDSARACLTELLKTRDYSRKADIYLATSLRFLFCVNYESKSWEFKGPGN